MRSCYKEWKIHVLTCWSDRSAVKKHINFPVYYMYICIDRVTCFHGLGFTILKNVLLFEKWVYSCCNVFCWQWGGGVEKKYQNVCSNLLPCLFFVHNHGTLYGNWRKTLEFGLCLNRSKMNIVSNKTNDCYGKSCAIVAYSSQDYGFESRCWQLVIIKLWHLDVESVQQLHTIYHNNRWFCFRWDMWYIEKKI